MTDPGYIFQETAGAPLKMWTRGVPVEDKAMEQLHNIASLPFVFRHVAAMPDCHWGYGTTVGSVFATKGAIIPAAVGVDKRGDSRNRAHLAEKGYWDGDCDPSPV